MASHFAPQHAKGKNTRHASGVSHSVGYSRSNASYYYRNRKSGKRGRRDDSSRCGRPVAVALAIALAVLLLAAGVASAMLFCSVMSVRDRASTVMAQASTLTDALKNGDGERLSNSVDVIVENANAIDDEVDSVLWNLAAYVPVLGEDIRSVQTLGAAAHSLVDDALVPITNSVSGMRLANLLQDGTVDIEMVRALSSSVSAALPVVQSSIDAITSLPEAHTPQLRDVLLRVQGPLNQAKSLLDQTAPILDVLPQMLGADGQTRTYLVIAQNNSELRSTGGLPGSWSTLSVTNGVITLGDSTSLVNKPGFDVPVSEEERINLGMTIGTNAAQMTMTPNFVRVGELAQGYWEQAGYGIVDGVIAVDPVFLQRLLGLTGGITAPDGTIIDGTSAARELLSGTYWKFGNDGAAQDEYFGAVAGLAFQHVMSNLGNTSLADLVDVVSSSAEDGRLLIWMADEQEEEVMKRMGLAGDLGEDPTMPELGVYFNDATVSKISWYASTGTVIGESVKNDDGTTTYNVTTTLTNTITEKEASAAPTYVSGGAADKRDASDMLDYVYFFAPAGGVVSDFIVSDGAMVQEGSSGVNANIYGLQVRYFFVHARAGETVTFSYKVTVSADAIKPLSLRTTPLAQESLIQ